MPPEGGRDRWNAWILDCLHTIQHNHSLHSLKPQSTRYSGVEKTISTYLALRSNCRRGGHDYAGVVSGYANLCSKRDDVFDCLCARFQPSTIMFRRSSCWPSPSSRIPYYSRDWCFRQLRHDRNMQPHRFIHMVGLGRLYKQRQSLRVQHWVDSTLHEIKTNILVFTKPPFLVVMLCGIVVKRTRAPRTRNMSRPCCRNKWYEYVLDCILFHPFLHTTGTPRPCLPYADGLRSRNIYMFSILPLDQRGV